MKISFKQDTLILLEIEPLNNIEDTQIENYRTELRFYLKNGRIFSCEIYAHYQDNRREFKSRKNYSYKLDNNSIQIEIDHEIGVNNYQNILRYVPKNIILNNIDLFILIIENETTPYFSWMISAIAVTEINGMLSIKH